MDTDDVLPSVDDVQDAFGRLFQSDLPPEDERCWLNDESNELQN